MTHTQGIGDLIKMKNKTIKDYLDHPIYSDIIGKTNNKRCKTCKYFDVKVVFEDGTSTNCTNKNIWLRWERIISILEKEDVINAVWLINTFGCVYWEKIIKKFTR